MFRRKRRKLFKDFSSLAEINVFITQSEPEVVKLCNVAQDERNNWVYTVYFEVKQ